MIYIVEVLLLLMMYIDMKKTAENESVFTIITDNLSH